MGRGKIGLEGDGFPQVFFGLVQAADLERQQAGLIVELKIMRPEPGGLMVKIRRDMQLPRVPRPLR
jgi:hypothetical protein